MASSESHSSATSSDSEDDGLVFALDDLKLGADATPKQVLVLIDFNNMLVFRDKSPGALARHQLRRPDFQVRYGKFWMRPYAREFVCRLLDDPRCKVAVYTSIERHNMEPVIKAFDRFHQNAGGNNDDAQSVSTYSSLYDGQIALFDQKFNALDPTGAKTWDTIRDLPRVWAQKVCKDNGFDSTNTLLIEGERRKAVRCMENTLIVDQYTDPAVAEDDTLRALADYIVDVVLARAQPPDAMTVPSILREHPREAAAEAS